LNHLVAFVNIFGRQVIFAFTTFKKLNFSFQIAHLRFEPSDDDAWVGRLISLHVILN